MLSKNRPEVLFSMGALMVGGCRNTPLHPLGSLDDHAYVLDRRGDRDAGLRPAASPSAPPSSHERVPGLKRCCRSARPTSAWTSSRSRPAFEPRALVAPAGRRRRPVGLGYTGGTTGKPKGVMNTYRSGVAMTQIQWPSGSGRTRCAS